MAEFRAINLLDLDGMLGVVTTMRFLAPEE
jgi:hypothetical protein